MQQNGLTPLARELFARGWWMEIETNGTIVPRQPGLIDLLNQVNCSPKLANSGDSEHMRIKPNALHALAANEKVNFKFVVGDMQDADEIITMVKSFQMQRVWIMGMGKTREELAKTTPIAKQMADAYGFKFSPRLHVELHGDKRGV